MKTTNYLQPGKLTSGATRPWHWPHKRIFGLLLPLAVVGCGSTKHGEVEGVVTCHGEPLPQVEILFLPDPDQAPTGPLASAYTDSHGRYRLRTAKTRHDGAIVGKHQVCLTDPRDLLNTFAQRSQGSNPDDQPDEVERVVVPGRMPSPSGP